MNRHVPGVAAALPAAVLAFVLAGCGAAGGSAGGGQGYVDAGVTGTRSTSFAPADRKPLPPVGGRTLDGRTLDLASLHGQIVVLNIWESTCAPCRREAPSLERVYTQTRAQGVRFVGLNTRDDDANARTFQRSLGITYPSIVDDDGTLTLRFRGELAAPALPTTYIVDRDGRVAARATDLLTEVKLRSLLAPVLAEKS